MQKRGQLTKPKVKKCGSLDDDSDRSLSPSDILDVKENKPVIQRVAVNNRNLTKGENVNTGISRPKSVTKPLTTKTTKTPHSKPPVTKTSKLAANNTKQRLLSPRRTIDRPAKTNNTAKPAVPSSKPSTPTKCLSPKSPSRDRDLTKSDQPLWKIPKVGKPSEIKPLPGRGGPKRQKKLYNPPSLFSLCKTAVQSVIKEPELAEESKDFVKRRMYSQVLIGTIWATLTKETKKNRISIENLITERDTLSAELGELKATLDSKITSLTQQHDSKLTTTTQQLTDKHNKLTAALKEGYDTTIADLKSQLCTIEVRHADELVAIRQSHATEMRTLHQQHDNQRNQLISQHNTHVQELEQTQRDLEEQNEYLDGMIKEKDENLKSEVDAQVQKQVQRYSTINAELQSLRDVIDIKKEENRRLNIDHNDFNTKIEEIKKLKHELGGLRDTNEQLRATIEMKTESERNLNMTQDSLKHELSLKEKDTKNIVHKFEELQYKLSNYEEILTKNNLQDPRFTPSFYSTPFSSPVNPRLTEKYNNKIISTPNSDIPKTRVCLFEAEDVETELLPIAAD